MRRPLLLFLFAISFGIAVLHYVDPLSLGSFLLPDGKLAPSEDVQYLEGIVTNAELKDGYVAVTLLCSAEKHAESKVRFFSDNEKVLIRLKADLTITQAADLVGRRAVAGGYLQLPDGRRNPGCFDYRLYLKGRRIFTIMKVSKYRFSAGEIKRPFLHILSLKKGEFLEAARGYMSEKSFSVMAGLLFGDTGYMDEDLYEEFRLNGIGHVLAVSGLHVGLLYAVIRKLLGGRQGPAASAAILVIVFIYAALSSFSVSVLRASFMVALHVLAPHLKRRYDMVNAATLCAIVFLLINPYQLFDAGFQLSFAAAYSMGVALPRAVSKGTELADKYKKKWIQSAFEISAPCVIVQLGMTPLIMFHFLTFSPVSLLLNPPALLLAGFLLPAGLVCFIVSLLFKGLPLIAACGAAEGFSDLLSLLSSAGNTIGASAYTCAPPLTGLVLWCVLFFWFFSETRIILNRRQKYLSLLITNICLIAASCILPMAAGLCESPLPWRYDDHPVTFLDVGQGDCIHLNIDGYNILIDGGGSIYSNIAKRTLRPYLLKNGIDHIDLAIITHQDTDHALGITQLQEIYPVDKTIVLGADNDDCGICLAAVDGIRILLMADAGFEQEAQLLEQFGDDIRCDVLKAGHHGSAYSTGEELIEAARPSFAVISCGRNNNYGHPSDRVIELLEKSGIIYGRTDEDGAVFLSHSEDGFYVFENAAGTKTWHIQRNRTIQNTLPEP